MKGRQIKYTNAELKWIEANKAMVRKESHALFIEKFGRNDISFNNYKALHSRNGWKTGRTGCFSKGQVSHNKGKPFNPKGSEKGRFKKGNKPHNTNYIGHERTQKDGYIEISVAEPNPYTGADRRYVLKHRHLWELENGPVPKGMCLKCLDGDRSNTDPTNWVTVERGLLPRLSGRWGKLAYDDAAPEVRPVILTIARIEQKARTMMKE